MATTRKEMYELCSEVEILRKKIRTSEVLWDVALSLAKDACPENKDLISALETGARDCQILPDSKAAVVRAVLDATESANRSKQNYRKKLKYEKEGNGEIINKRKTPEEKEALKAQKTLKEDIKEKLTPELLELVNGPKEDKAEWMRKYNEEIRGLTPNSDVLYGTASVGELQEGEDYM